MTHPSERPEPGEPPEHADADHVDPDQGDAGDARRAALVATAQRQWIDLLTDLGGRNTLLYYKDRRAGTLDLADADPDAVERLEKTGARPAHQAVPRRRRRAGRRHPPHAGDLP